MPSCWLAAFLYNKHDDLPNSTLISSFEISPTGEPPLGVPHIIAISTIIVGAVLLLNVLFYYINRREVRNRRSEEDTEYGLPNGDLKEIRSLKSLNFDFRTLKIATDNFSEDNKLGAGGFGDVFKGKLRNKQEIAVKILSKNSEQGTKEFKNEVLLLARLQHRNLIKFLGYCVSGKEKILVYELVSNSSLDRFLFGPLKSASLDWQTRFKIIDGIARGVMYLHEDSRLKIIHRDLKTSNILLDQEMNAKVSDFGLAKLFSVDETQGGTMRVVGTYGYMAPEYAMAGQYSGKSDAYSFGVIILELVSGQRNSFSHLQADEGLLYRAWRLWNDDAALELVDPVLGRDMAYEKEKILMCIQIGLLCIQDDPTKRPTMASIVAALNGQSITMPLPQPPQFFKASAVAYTNLSINNSKTESEIQQHQCTSSHSGTLSITELCPR